MGVDIQQSLKVNYKFDHFLRSMGQVINIDFEKDCINFLAGTKLGWIQIWDLQNKMLKRRFKIVNSITKLPEPINYIKLKREKRTILAFN